MVTSCVIRRCSSVWNPLWTTSFHSFPCKNPELLEKWIEFIPTELIGTMSRSSRICSLHFAEECFSETLTGKKTLNKNAVPTLFGSEVRPQCAAQKEFAVSKENDSDIEEGSETEKDDSEPEFDRKIYYANTKGIYKRRFKTVGVQTLWKNNKVTPKEIYFKRQIILLKRRLARRESRIKAMSELVKALETIITQQNKDGEENVECT